MKKHIGIVALGLIIVLVLVLYMVTFTVRWQEKALVVTFGKISRKVDTPGLKWKWPWQREVTFDGRIQTLQQQPVETQTKDKQTIIVSTYVNWRISDPRVFYERFRQSGASGSEDAVAYAENIMANWISEGTNVFAEYNLGELVTLDKARFKLAVIEKGQDGQTKGMIERIREKSPNKDYGIEIIDLGIRKLGVPDSVCQSVFDRMKEERQAVVLALKSAGESQAASIMGDARRDATFITAEAQAKAKSIRGQGDSEAAVHYAKFLANSELANYLRKLETLRTTLNNRTTLILNNESPAYELLRTGPEITSETGAGSVEN